MPKTKSKNSKRKQTSEPYSRRDNNTEKKDASDTEEGEPTVLYCDKCTSAVERLLQCEKCLIWYCLNCSKVINEVLNMLNEYDTLHWFCDACNVTAT